MTDQGGPTPTITINAAEDKITRSNGSWETDGFEAGQFIAIHGTANSDGIYQVKSITDSAADSELVLEEDLTGTGTNEPAQVFAVDNFIANDPIQLGSETTIDFNAANDTITRDDGVYWDTDGFKEDQYIRVVGSGNSNDGTYRITSIIDDVLTVSGALQNELDSTANVVVQAVRQDTTSMDLSTPTDLEYIEKRTTIHRDSGSWLEAGLLTSTSQVTIGSDIYNVIDVTASDIVLEQAYGVTPGEQPLRIWNLLHKHCLRCSGVVATGWHRASRLAIPSGFLMLIWQETTPRPIM